MPRKPPTDRISASTDWPFMAMSEISPTVSFFWFVTDRPLILEENISSLPTDWNLASAGALPVVLCSSAAKAGVASTASEAAINTNFFILSSSEAVVLLHNAKTEHWFPRNRQSRLRMPRASRCRAAQAATLPNPSDPARPPLPRAHCEHRVGRSRYGASRPSGGGQP